MTLVTPMRNLLASPASTSLGLLLARVPLGAFFVVAGFGKFTTPGGVPGFVSGSAAAVPRVVPEALGRIYLNAVPYAEVLVGAMLVLGVMARVAGALAAAMLVSFIVAVTGIRDPNLPFHPNVIFLGIALLVLLAGPGSISMERFIWGGQIGGATTR